MDFTSSEDEFDDYFFGSDEKLHRSHWRDNYVQNHELTDAEKKERQIKNFYMYLINGRVEEVLSEINAGLDVNQKLQDDWMPILVAASIANYELVNELHKKGADVKSTRGGFTTLMLAANCPETTTPFERSVKVVELLLELGVDPNARNRSRINALMFAASNGNLEVMKLLLPVTDLSAEDNQHWNALFWAVNSGKIQAVEFLIENGVPIDKVDVRENSLLDLARNNGHDDIIELFTSEEDNEDYYIDQCITNFEDIFQDLEKRERPQFFLDIVKILYGTRSENVIKSFSEKEVSLYEFLSSNEDDLATLGVEMPFQRRRLMAGIYRFHKYPYHPKSVPTVAKNEIFSTMDVSAAILSTVKQITVLEASLKYLMKNSDSSDLFSHNDIKIALSRIEKQLEQFKPIIKKLKEKAIQWDCEVEPVNIITNRSGKRWFPWRKIIFTVGVVVVISTKIWSKPFRLKL